MEGRGKMNRYYSCWEVLGIAPTKDKREIKKAYAKKAKTVHPEENQDEFINLRNAYEAAMNFASDNNYQEPQIIWYRASSQDYLPKQDNVVNDENNFESNFLFDFNFEDEFKAESQNDYRVIDAIFEKLTLSNEDRSSANYYINNLDFRKILSDKEQMLYFLKRTESISSKIFTRKYSEILKMLNLLKEIWEDDPSILNEIYRLCDDKEFREKKKKRKRFISFTIVIFSIIWVGLIIKKYPEEQLRKENSNYNSRIMKLYGKNYEVIEVENENEKFVLKFDHNGDLRVIRLIDFENTQAKHQEIINRSDFNRVLVNQDKVIVKIFLPKAEQQLFDDKIAYIYLTDSAPRITILSLDENDVLNGNPELLSSNERDAQLLIEEREETEKKEYKDSPKSRSKEEVAGEKRELEYIIYVTKYHEDPDNPIFKSLTDEQRQQLVRDYENLMKGITDHYSSEN